MQHLWLCAVCLVLAVVFILIEKAEHFVLADVIKGCASLCFVIVGILGATVAGDARYAWTIVGGLALGAVADVLLNLRHVFSGNKSQRAFLIGILVFFLGHVVYVCALAPRCPNLIWCIAIGAVIGVALLLWIFTKITASVVFKVFGLFYMCTICIMNVTAIGVLLATPTADAAIFVGGAVLFLVSDVLLILYNFGEEKLFSMRVANLMLYYLGQLAIALSLQLVA